jgi:O-antigen/teichoic acid export membrane protein
MFFKRLANKIGIDKAILFTSSSTLIGALGNVISAILVIKFLSIEEQGFYYTFGSLAAVQIFFELGLNGIITQFVAHENAKLQWDGEAIKAGDEKNKSRLSSLLHFCIKWYLFFSTILIFVLIITGIYFFKSYSFNNNQINWIAPWVLLAITTSFNLLISPIIAFIQGLGKVKEIANFQLIAQILRLVIVFASLLLGFKLYVLGIGNLVLFITMFIFVMAKFMVHLIGVWNIKNIEKVDYFKEIFPYQWKIALSWLSGYFIFQLFNPVLFATEGPKVAGQMGLTLTALNGILTLSFAWMTTKIPLFSTLIANKNYQELDTVFNKSLKQSILINSFLLIFFYSFIYVLRNLGIKIGVTLISDRFIPFLPLFFMMCTILLNLIVSSWATYLRCHKKEPYLLNSIVAGVLSAASTIILGKYYGLLGISAGYLLLNILMFPWAYKIFTDKRKLWHQIA